MAIGSSISLFEILPWESFQAIPTVGGYIFYPFGKNVRSICCASWPYLIGEFVT
jgi:hypothetical protein